VANASSVGAIDPGRGRSRLLSVSARNAARAADGIHVRLTLREGVGELAGRVLDPAGRPVRGAFVLLGTDHATVVEDDNEVVIREGARTVAACPVMEAETDAAGVFAFHSLTPGRREIVIRARGFAPWTGMVQVTAGASATLEARLARGATLVGTVRTSDGKPVPGAEVATGYADAIASSLARSDAAGAFRLEALPAGRIEVEARTQERGRAKTVLAAREGQELRWDATLVGALELRGRVLDHLGSPLADWTIRVRADTHGPFSWPPVSETKTDPEGRFLIPHCADLPYRVEFEDQSTFTVDVRRVRPGSGELTFRIGAEVRATAFLTGSIVDAEDRPQGGATVWLLRSGPGRDEELQGMTGRGTGRFRLGPLPPGRYRLRYAGGNPTCPMFFTEEREVASGATLDLGTLRIVAGGTLRLTAKDETGLDVSGSYGSLLWGADGGQSVASMTFDRGLVRWGLADGEGDRVLAPGRYVILVGGEGFACARHDFEIRSGGEAHVDLVLRRGTRRTFVIDTVDPDDPLIRARLVVLDAFGKPVSDSGLWFRGESRTTATGWFLPGTYRARATVGSRASEAGFRVEAGAIRGGTVRIVLK
jgi:protocatechuate 3,4-dioxygenase beta subunit